MLETVYCFCRFRLYATARISFRLEGSQGGRWCRRISSTSREKWRRVTPSPRKFTNGTHSRSYKTRWNLVEFKNWKNLMGRLVLLKEGEKYLLRRVNKRSFCFWIRAGKRRSLSLSTRDFSGKQKTRSWRKERGWRISRSSKRRCYVSFGLFELGEFRKRAITLFKMARFKTPSYFHEWPLS